MVNEPVVRVPSLRVQGSFYRFHRANRFAKSSDQFFLNFIDTRPKFRAQERFAPATAHCGHYLASSEQVAATEMMYYTRSDAPGTPSASQVLLASATSSVPLLLTCVTLDLDNLVDFREASNVDTFLREGSFKWRGRPPEYEIQYLARLLSKDRGGNDMTDVLGVDIRVAGYVGVVFPSVRAVMLGGELPERVRIRQGYDAIVRGSSAGNIMDLQWQGLQQLQQEYNLVVFSGTTLTRAITEVTWLSADGETGHIRNPFHGAEGAVLERARLQERTRRGLDPVQAAIMGLLSDAESENEFYDETMFAPGPSRPGDFSPDE